MDYIQKLVFHKLFLLIYKVQNPYLPLWTNHTTYGRYSVAVGLIWDKIWSRPVGMGSKKTLPVERDGRENPPNGMDRITTHPT